jgi:hypothetical protein
VVVEADLVQAVRGPSFEPTFAFNSRFSRVPLGIYSAVGDGNRCVNAIATAFGDKPQSFIARNGFPSGFRLPFRNSFSAGPVYASTVGRQMNYALTVAPLQGKAFELYNVAFCIFAVCNHLHPFLFGQSLPWCVGLRRNQRAMPRLAQLQLWLASYGYCAS